MFVFLLDMTIIKLDLKFDDKEIERGTFADCIGKKIEEYFGTKEYEAHTKGVLGISKEKLKDILLGSKTEVCYHKNNSCETLDKFLNKLNESIGITLTNAASLLMSNSRRLNTQTDYSNKAIEWFNHIEKSISDFNTIIIPDMYIISLRVGNLFDTYIQTLESKLASTNKEIYIPQSYSLKNNSYV